SPADLLIGFGRRNTGYLGGDTLPASLALHKNIRPTIFVDELSSAIVMAFLLGSPNHHRAVAVNTYFQIVRRRILVSSAVGFQFFGVLGLVMTLAIAAHRYEFICEDSLEYCRVTSQVGIGPIFF